VGLLTDSKVDGDYGQKTTRDMRIFQEWVNDQLGSDVLPGDGKCDELTYQYLQYSAVNGFKVVDTAPTVTPGAVTSLDIYVDGEKVTGGIRYVSGATASISWSATGSVQSYYVSIVDHNGNPVASADDITYTTVAIDTSSMVPGVNYTVKVSAVPVGGSLDNAAKASAQFALVSLNTPAPTAAPEEVIDASSPADEVRPVQERLIQLGLLPQGENDGAYGSKTEAAVRAFQEWFNENYGEAYGMLPVTGTCDLATAARLAQAVELGIQLGATAAPEITAAPEVTPTATPVVTPTPEPEPTEETGPAVGPESDPDSIRFVQGMLAQVGLMEDGSDSGVYDEDTEYAVTRFQNWFNDTYGVTYGELDVTGLCDALTLQWLEQCAEQGIKVEEPDQRVIAVDANSDAQAIAYLQDMLVTIGVMDGEMADGTWNQETVDGLTLFCEWFNENYGANYGELIAGDACDEDTLTRLEQAVEKGVWIDRPEPTSAPTEVPAEPTEAPAEPTAEPTAAPTPEPTEEPVVTPAPTSDTVTAGSDPALVKQVQTALYKLGLMSEGDVDGDYGNMTREAVRSFQEWFNQNYGASHGMLEETGECDKTTLEWMNKCVESGIVVVVAPTAAPATPVPTETPAPEATPVNYVDASSGAEYIKKAQQLLIGVGLLDEGDDDGYWGKMTEAALQRFQEWFNANYGAEYGMLTVQPAFDEATLGWLMACIENGITVPLTDPTPTPAPEPTEMPAPEATPVNYVDASSDSAYIKKAQKLLIDVGLLPEGYDDGYWGSKTEEALKRFQEWFNANYGAEYGMLTVQPAFDEATLGWLMACIENGITVPATDPTPTPAPEATPVNYVDASSDAEYIKKAQQLLIGVGLLDEGDDDGYWGKMTEAAVQRFQEWFNANYGESHGMLTVQPAFDEATIGWLMACIEQNITVPAEDPTEPPAAPTEAPAAPEPTEAPAVGTVSAPQLGVTSESYADGGVTYVTGESITFIWPADGDVDHYYVYLEDSNGMRNELGNVNVSSMTISTANFTQGAAYKLCVYAYPVNGSDSDAVSSSLTFIVAGDGPAEDEPEEEMPETITPDSDPVWIFAMQDRLYQLGWFDEDEWQHLEQGVFDDYTLVCIIEFQMRVNAIYGAGTVPVIDPNVEGFELSSAVVDELTLRYLMDETLNIAPEIAE